MALIKFILGLPHDSIIRSTAFSKLSDDLYNFIQKGAVDIFSDENSLRYFVKPVSD